MCHIAQQLCISITCNVAYCLGYYLSVRELLEIAREAAVKMRQIDEQVEIRRQMIGVQGHNSFEVHAKSGILDPMRHVIDLMEWQESLEEIPDLNAPIEEAYSIMAGIAKIADGVTVEVVTRYYLQGMSLREIVDGCDGYPPLSERTDGLDGLPKQKQLSWVKKAMDLAIDQWELIGIAHLKEMGQS